MRERATFWREAIGRGWQQAIHLKDHAELAVILGGGLFALAGFSAILAYANQQVWIAPVVVVGILLLMVTEGAYAQWKDADDKAQSFNVGQSLQMTAPEPVKGGGRIHTPLRVDNPNDEPMPDCYVRMVSCEASGGGEEYRGPPEGYHYPWSTYEGKGEGAITSIGRRSSAVLDFAFGVTDNANCYVPHLDKLTGKIDAHFALLRGQHVFFLEAGSKTAKIAPSHYRVVLSFGGGVDLKVESVELAADTQGFLPESA